MKMQRSAGILLPVSSLPSPYGIGCFSQEAYDFVDWLKEAGQTYWQILPLGVTSYGDSPYQSFSAFAGNPYFISLDELVKEGWGNDFKESYRYLDKVIARLRKYLPKGGAVEIVTSWGRGFGLMVKKDSNES